MTRHDPDGLEANKQHNESPGPVADEEIMCRGGFDPMHYKKGKLKPSIVKNDDLLHGSLSVWRGGKGDTSEFLAAVNRVQTRVPSEQELKEVFTPRAGQIRDIELTGFQRVFYVIDDCQIDDAGNSDPLHAGVMLASSLNVSSAEDDTFIQAKAQLIRVMKAHSRQPTVEPPAKSLVADT